MTLNQSEWTEGWHLWDLIYHLNVHVGLGKGAIFRGQSNSDWKLVPNLYRRPVHIYGPPIKNRYLMAEERMIDAFFDRALLLLPRFDREKLIDRVIAQHYSIPTQLLDWTLDPFIALYFAVEDYDSDKDGAFFYIDPLHELNHRAKIQIPYENKIAKFVPPIIDERVRTQKSVFTLQNFGTLEEEFLPLDDRNLKISGPKEQHPEDEVEAFGKVIIPSKRKKQVFFDLLKMGIDSSSLFPGLQGIGQRISDMANIQNYGGNSNY